MGTTIGPIFTLGFSQTISDQAVALSPGYALGLGLPFLALAVLVDRALGSVSGRRKYLQTFQWINGLFLILLGALLLTSQVAIIAIWAQRNGFFLNLPYDATAISAYLADVAAGARSFPSPCVLPRVPAYPASLDGAGLRAQD